MNPDRQGTPTQAAQQPRGSGTGMRRGGAVRTIGLTMVYGEGRRRLVALDALDLEVPAGQLLCILGPSGSGKTTLLNLLAGLQKPTSGQVFIDQTEISALSTRRAALFRRHNVAIVFQFFNMVSMLSLEANIALPLILDGVYLDRVLPGVARALERLGIGHCQGYAIEQLSGGELQRAALARALFSRPRVIFADEPTGNLDSATGRQVLSLLHKFSRDECVTIIMFTHDLRAVSYSDRVIALRDGRIEEDVAVWPPFEPEAEGAGTRST